MIIDHGPVSMTARLPSFVLIAESRLVSERGGGRAPALRPRSSTHNLRINLNRSDWVCDGQLCIGASAWWHGAGAPESYRPYQGERSRNVSAIQPLPITRSPSKKAMACPGVTARCGSSKRTRVASVPWAVTPAQAALWRERI